MTGRGAFGDTMGPLGAGIHTVGIDNDPEQFKQSAILILTLPLLNCADSVIPFEDVNFRFSKRTLFPEPQEGHLQCFCCSKIIRVLKEGCKFVYCGDEYICGK